MPFGKVLTDQSVLHFSGLILVHLSSSLDRDRQSIQPLTAQHRHYGRYEFGVGRNRRVVALGTAVRAGIEHRIGQRIVGQDQPTVAHQGDSFG